jgi:uncharacterized protein DUF955
MRPQAIAGATRRTSPAELAAVRLLISAGVRRRPVPVYALARRVGIIDVAHEPINSAALLQRGPIHGTWGAILRRSDPREERRFSLAHEIGHVLLDRGRSLDLRGAAYRSHENAMERFAAALLRGPTTVGRPRAAS